MSMLCQYNSVDCNKIVFTLNLIGIVEYVLERCLKGIKSIDPF